MYVHTHAHTHSLSHAHTHTRTHTHTHTHYVHVQVEIHAPAQSPVLQVLNPPQEEDLFDQLPAKEGNQGRASEPPAVSRILGREDLEGVSNCARTQPMNVEGVSCDAELMTWQVARGLAAQVALV
jgi:hypothetical protein